jgi:hypothetical protein
MGVVMIELIVSLYDGRIWQAVVFRIENGDRVTARHVFGSEPSEEEVFDFVIHLMFNLKFVPVQKAEGNCNNQTLPSFKRRQRQVRKELSGASLRTASQEAVRLIIESGKLERKVNAKKLSEEKRVRVFQLQQEKRKQKKRGH